MLAYTLRRLLSLVVSLLVASLVIFMVVEVAPAYDHADITALAGATLAHDYLCLLAAKKGATAREIGQSLDAKVSVTASNEVRSDDEDTAG